MNDHIYNSQVKSDVFCHSDVRCFYLTVNKTAYIHITKTFDQSEFRNQLTSENQRKQRKQSNL